MPRHHCFKQIDLDASLDASECRRQFRRWGRLLISRILRVDCAIALSDMMREEQDWNLSIAASAIGRRFTRSNELDWTGMRDAFDAAYADRGKPFTHLYETKSITSYADNTSEAGKLYVGFLEFVNSVRFLSFIRSVVGIETIESATAVLTKYSPGGFYATHVDSVGGRGHRASFILNLTPTWEPIWGGLLQFKDQSGAVAHAYVPRFNSLSLFDASQEHAVSMVAPFAPFPRLSIGGALVVKRSSCIVGSIVNG